MTEEQYSTKNPIKIVGLEELAQQMPDDDWRELRVYFRKGSSGAEIRIGQTLNKVGIASQ